MKKVLLLTLMAMTILSGCGTNNEAQNEKQEEPHTINVKESTIQNVDRYSGQEISKHLVELATSLPNVNDATAVVLGRYAIVGIDVNEKLDRSKVGSIKYSVAESLKKDPHGANAVVIADPDMTARLREIGEDIENGKPIRGIMNELAAISGRLMPEIPADIIEPDPENSFEDPKNKLNNKEEKQFEEHREEQSKHHLNQN
ncbi:YhcN/YlaJ family sporulation lipoprotein [Cytobacillus sp. FJAT-54145]|uniref:YhcN/YlaJ family sporulation lipoprotein n=1 Tax=Cytobacillus spartinae TaxID=3299023 RepID=A0ABW6KJD6_9BACI